MDRADTAAPGLDPDGRRHLVILDEHVATPGAAGVADVCTWRLGETHASLDDLATALTRRLAVARIGERLYLSGGHAFLAQLTAAALAAGMLADEIRQHPVEGRLRRVVCAACRSTALVPADAAHINCACGARLAVRRQLSPRLGACLGVPC
ncbi:dimethylamine monooxygenase subunit DmmA family protein [Ancylobacter lacus]|uniref:dimethylamine monooxygenase subunit DmmA family protein n=1 Tax=Ancylobacter lacus TaxID=2579970 RepID=UPI001BD0C741|nr:dimethylamine monooxygenase subunit DmmA family protein [Ancylobacter lacus]MBS7540334.1 hypothetical protein [Ancylobacter lacus]